MDAPYRIRPAEWSDLAAVTALERAVFPDPWSLRGFAGHLREPFLLAESRDGHLLGYVVTRVTADEGEILNVAVEPGRRRSGIGRALVRDAVHAVRAAGVRRLHLEVRASNSAALGLYQSEGFAAVGRRQGYYRNPPEDALLLARNIDPA